MPSYLIWFALLLAVAPSAQAQTAEMAARLERLLPIQQHQFKALVDSRDRQPGAKYFSNKEVVESERLSADAISRGPLGKTELASLAEQTMRLFGSAREAPLRIVDENTPVYRYCSTCADRLGPTCHSAAVADLRPSASKVLKDFPDLASSVVAIYARFGTDAFAQIGTGFFASGFLLTNKHVGVDYRYVSGINEWVGKINPDAQIEVALQGTTQRVQLPANTKVWVHRTADVMAFDWPASLLPLARRFEISTDTVSPGEKIAVLGYPTLGTTSDSSNIAAKVYGLCPGQNNVDLGLRMSQGIVEAPITESFFHTANTLGNNSGSPVFLIKNGRVIGIHASEGGTSDVNLALASRAILDLLAKVQP